MSRAGLGLEVRYQVTKFRKMKPTFVQAAIQLGYQVCVLNPTDFNATVRVLLKLPKGLCILPC